MSHRSFKTRDTYLDYKARERSRYYGRTEIRPYRRWEKWEEDYIENNIDALAIDIATYLNRTIKSIEHKRESIRKRLLAEKSE